MRKKVFALLLAAALVLCCAGPALPAEAAGVFLAVDDTLLSSAPYVSGGTAYVPYSVLSYFGIYSAYFETGVISLYTSSLQLNFDLNNGGCQDAAGNSYTASAIYYGGIAYVPVVFCATYFGAFSFSYITSSYGDVLRLTSGAQVLSDREFINAAASAMGGGSATHTPTPAPTPSASPSPTPTPTPERDRSDVTVYLSFTGLPSERAAELLRQRDLRCGFFLSAEDIRSDPEQVRALAGQGHTLGVVCGQDAGGDWAEAAQLLFEAAGIWPTMLAPLPEGEAAAAALAEEWGLALWLPEINGETVPPEDRSLVWYTGQLAGAAGSVGVQVARPEPDGEGDAELDYQLLRYLLASGYTLGTVRETVLLEGN